MHYVGLDVHMQYTHVQHMDSSGALGLVARIDTSEAAFEALFSRFEFPVSVSLEAGGNWWWIVQLLSTYPNVESVKVVDARRSRRLSEELSVRYGYGRAKNDRIDAQMLAHADRLGISPTIHLPDPGQLERRTLVRHRQNCLWQQSAVSSRVAALLRMHGLAASGLMLSRNYQVYAAALQRLPGYVLLMVNQLLEQIALIQQQVAHTEHELEKVLPASDEQIHRLMGVPGIGIVVARIICAEIFSIAHFDAPKHLISYSGLAPIEHESAGKKSGVKLNRHCNYYLKYAFLTAAHGARQYHKYSHKYTRDVKQHGKMRAKIILARRLAKAVFWMLTRQQPFQ